ncbi:MAG: hypothetical protein IJC18_06260 [Clostridia bacterium]|nr:hypothetical protein [Clostridia bacterium]
MNQRIRERRMKNMMVFAAGAVAYTAAELLWRGHSHWTMTLTGGACALMIHLANRRMRPCSMIKRCGVGCGIITAAELSVGCIVNLLLGWNVWDYSALPLNLLGQICLLYSVMWFILSFPVIALSTWIDSRRGTGVIVFE